MVDRSRGATGSVELRSFLGARQHGRFASKWAGALGSFCDAPDATREREAAAVENAIVRSGAARAARAGLLGARQDRSITRPDGHADAVAIDGAVEARLLRAQVGLLRDFADHLHDAATRQPVRPVRLASAARPRVPSPEDARAFIDRAGFVWGQRWELAPGVFTPGGYDVSWLLGAIGLPADLTGASVLDVGTGNGVAAFEAERRGANRVVAVDGPPSDAFGVGALAELLGSRVEYLQAPAYEVAALLGGERFDVVLCLGLLPHLRHPLLALDALRSVTAGELLIETAVSDHELDEPGQPLARFYRRDELGGDPTNWLAPTSAGLLAWCASCGFNAELAGEWPPGRPERVAVRCRPSPGIPEWQRLGAA
jgi:tRNA (mo5U34)-methyltransferase